MLRAPLDNPTSRLDTDDLSSGHTSHRHEGCAGPNAWTIVLDTIRRVFTPGRRSDLRSLHDSGDRPTIGPVHSDNVPAAADDSSSNIQPASADPQLPMTDDAPSVQDTDEGLPSAVHDIASRPEAETSVASHHAVSNMASTQAPGQSVSIPILTRESFAHIPLEPWAFVRLGQQSGCHCSRNLATRSTGRR